MKRFLAGLLLTLALIAPVLADGTLSLVGIGPGTAGAALNPTIAFESSTSSTSSASSFTFNTQAIGSATSDRLVAVCTATSSIGNITINSVTINGNTATQIVQVANGAFSPSALHYLAVPTGTTANFVITLSGTAGGGAAINVFSVKDYLSATPVSSASSTSDPASMALSSVTNGMAAACATGLSGTGVNWSGGVTETSDFNVAGAFPIRVSSAIANNVTGAITPSGDITGSPSNPRGVAANWQ